MTTSNSEKPIAEEIVEHYASYDESKRLTDGFGLLERERTKELINRYLPSSQAVIIDVGGAAGVYSFWLASLGHRVHLVDIVPKHIERAKQMSAKPDSPRPASMRVGDARDCGFPDEVADVIIMHGPLYHLTEQRLFPSP
jgi:2-polyprenyl-3-methyl-5-hydroxy-6-metoxy-1,4-benzoquinol methylase